MAKKKVTLVEVGQWECPKCFEIQTEESIHDKTEGTGMVCQSCGKQVQVGEIIQY